MFVSPLDDFMWNYDESLFKVQEAACTDLIFSYAFQRENGPHKCISGLWFSHESSFIRCYAVDFTLSLIDTPLSGLESIANKPVGSFMPVRIFIFFGHPANLDQIWKDGFLGSIPAVLLKKPSILQSILSSLSQKYPDFFG